MGNFFNTTSELDAFDNDSYILIRHAMSTANKAQVKDGNASWVDPSLFDAQLCEEGVKQCLESQTRQKLVEAEIACVFVSPMRRAMQTAYYLLKDRPDFAQIQFIVNPLCREHLQTSGDIPLPYEQCENVARSLFPKVDTETCFKHYKNPDHYFVEDLVKDPEAKQKMMDQIFSNPQ